MNLFMLLQPFWVVDLGRGQTLHHVGSGRGTVPPAWSYPAVCSGSTGLCHSVALGPYVTQTVHRCSWGFACNLSQQKVNKKSINWASNSSVSDFLLTFCSRFPQFSKIFILSSKKLPFPWKEVSAANLTTKERVAHYLWGKLRWPCKCPLPGDVKAWKCSGPHITIHTRNCVSYTL